jgi:hypothetical protein
LIDQIPEDLFTIRRIEDKWSIHEQVCHLVEAQEILEGRFRLFEESESPFIASYSPPEDRGADYYMTLNMEEELAKFPVIREDLLRMLRGYDSAYWEKQGGHEVFTPYNTKLLLIHTLNVDYAHLFSIEQLGLTKRGLEGGIMTLP